MPRDVHIVGSVPFANAEEVFTVLSAALGKHLTRIPDGETGERLTWIGWLGRVFAPADDVFRVHEQATPTRRYRLKPGRTVSDIRIEKLPYAEHAFESYGTFRRLRDAGKIRPGTKFQVDFAPGHTTVRSPATSSTRCLGRSSPSSMKRSAARSSASRRRSRTRIWRSSSM
jgi:hypothetical protein